MTHNKNNNQPCCPKFDPGPWDGKMQTWTDKPFIKSTTPQFLHMPLLPLYSRTIARMWKQAKENGAAPPPEDFLLLAYDPSPWKSELYLATTGKIQGADNVALSGTFFSRVFDGPYNAVPKWIKEMEAQIAGKSLRVKRYYFYYTTCPKCARIYGHNYAVALAQVE